MLRKTCSGAQACAVLLHWQQSPDVTWCTQCLQSVVCRKAPRRTGHNRQGTERPPPTRSRFGEPGLPLPPPCSHRGGRIWACGLPAANSASSNRLHGQHSHSPAHTMEAPQHRASAHCTHGHTFRGHNP